MCCVCQGICYLQSALQTPLPFVRISLTLLPGVFGRETVGEKERKRWNRMRALFIEKPQAVFNKENPSVCSKRMREERNRESKWLTSTSPVRSLYLSRMIGSAGFSFRVLERSLKGCSGAGEGMDRTISFSPRLWLRLWEPLHNTMTNRSVHDKEHETTRFKMWVPSTHSLYSCGIQMKLYMKVKKKKKKTFTIFILMTVKKYVV